MAKKEGEYIYEREICSYNFEVKIYMPEIYSKVHEEIDVEQFVAWYGKRHGVELKKNSKNNSYYYGDGYTRHAITICEKSEDFDYILIQFKTGRYDL